MLMNMKSMLVWEEVAPQIITDANYHGDIQRILDAMARAHTHDGISVEEWARFTINKLDIQMQEAA